MELKKAVAVCLISMFSATLVLLIARALDLQAANRLEPQLARIVEELEAIRKRGGIPITPTTAQTSDTVDDGLIVYYFHSNVRCATCQAIESQSHETVQTAFESELADGQMVWKTINYEEVDGEDLGRQFEVQVPVVVLAQRNSGQLGEWKRLDRVWALVSDKEAFADYVEAEIRKMLASSSTSADLQQGRADLPISAVDQDTIPAPGEDTADLPIPQGDSTAPPDSADDIDDSPIPDESSDIPIPN
jgi:hypothetical protein